MFTVTRTRIGNAKGTDNSNGITKGNRKVNRHELTNGNSIMVNRKVKHKSINELSQEQFLAADIKESKHLRQLAKEENYKLKIAWWPNLFLIVFLHASALYGLYHLCFTAKWWTVLWVPFLWSVSGMGVTAGAHRLWTHKSYKANFPLRLLLVMRLHHKFESTDADPHNVNRGFFFAHMGWLMVQLHPQVVEKSAQIDISDLYAEKLLVFQRKYYLLLALLFGFLLPTAIPVYFWGEQIMVAFFTAGMFRYALTLQTTFLVNSVAHIWGYRPYNSKISASESYVTMILAGGEGGHNYHHMFPQDYRTSEMDTFRCNITKKFIDFFAQIGWAYDLKIVSVECIERQKDRHKLNRNDMMH